MSRREGLHALTRARAQFWVCPIKGHSEGAWRDEVCPTVEWRRNIAYCLAPGCWRTSADRADAWRDQRVVTDDGRVWWLLGADTWTGVQLYEARNARSALAAYRRDLYDAERANGRTVRDAREIPRTAGLRVLAGPLGTVEAFQYDLARAYADELEQWQSHTIDVACSATPMTAIDLAERVHPPSKAAVIRREVAAKYLPPVRRYVATSLAAALTRGEYRILPNDRIRARCLDCGQLVEGATIDPFPQHLCIPTPDPDLEP